MKLRVRRLILVLAAFAGVVVWVAVNPASYEVIFTQTENEGADYAAGVVTEANPDAPLATEILEKLEVKGRAPKTGYARTEFYNNWPTMDGCNLRQRIIKREFGDTAVLDGCTVVSGEFDEPYTGEHRVFTEKSQISKIQIDHVVALSDAWQKGAQYLAREVRYEIATDPLNLLAVDGPANEQKSDGDAATWLPPNKKFRCQYVARQVSDVLTNCPKEPAIGV